MQIEITKVSVSRKGTVWLQAKVVDGYGESIQEGDKLDCEFKPELKEEPEDEKPSELV